MTLSGSAFTFAGAEQALEEGLQAIESGQSEFDLSGMSPVDSSGIAVLLAWQRTAQARGHSLRLLNPPSGMISLAEMYGVSDLLPFAQGGT